MSVMLSQLYEGIKDTEEIKLIAGEGGLNHVVRWVHMVESTDISSFLEGEEVTFTTGIGLKSQEELLELVQVNFHQNAAGMVINVGPYIEKIGTEIIEFADEHDFPIFEVPWRVHMANIMRYCTMQINLDEQKQIELASAIRNAVIFSMNEDMYIPAMLNLGYKRDWLYGITILEFWKKQSVLVDKDSLRKIYHFATEQFHSLKGQLHVLAEEERIVLFFYNLSEEKLRELIKAFEEKVITCFLPDGKIYVGIGRPTNHLNGIGKCYKQSEQVLQLQKKRNAKNQVILYGELGLYKLLLGMEDSELLQEFYQEHLGKLEKFDRMNETDYMFFLRQYFERGCSLQEVAASLHMHRNSVTYKLHKVEEITGFSMSEQSVRTRFMVAFMIQEIHT